MEYIIASLLTFIHHFLCPIVAVIITTTINTNGVRDICSTSFPIYGGVKGNLANSTLQPGSKPIHANNMPNKV